MEQSVSNNCIIESAANIFSKSLKLPILSCLHSKLLPFTLKPHDILKISYDDNAPRNLIINEIITNALLPEEFGGASASVAFLHADNNFDIGFLTDIIEKNIKKFNNTDSAESLIKSTLEKLHIIPIYDSQHFLVTVHGLEQVILQKCNISLIIIDNISAFYWSDRMLSSNITMMDAYVSNILKLLHEVTKDYRPVILYMEPNYYTVKYKRYFSEKSGIRANHEIYIERIDAENTQNTFQIIVKSQNKPIKFNIIVKNKQIYWL